MVRTAASSKHPRQGRSTQSHGQGEGDDELAADDAILAHDTHEEGSAQGSRRRPPGEGRDVDALVGHSDEQRVDKLLSIPSAPVVPAGGLFTLGLRARQRGRSVSRVLTAPLFTLGSRQSIVRGDVHVVHPDGPEPCAETVCRPGMRRSRFRRGESSLMGYRPPGCGYQAGRIAIRKGPSGAMLANRKT